MELIANEMKNSSCNFVCACFIYTHSYIKFIRADSWWPSSGCIGKLPRVRICAFFSSSNCLPYRRNAVTKVMLGHLPLGNFPSHDVCVAVEFVKCCDSIFSCLFEICVRIATLWQQRGITVGAFAIKVNIPTVTPFCGSVACNLNTNKSARAIA